MKKLGLFLFALLLAVSPAMAVIEKTIGETYQCWDFGGQTSNIGILASGNNPYGTPSANINDLSVTGDLEWTDNYGGWFGSDFMVILDIPNSPDNGPDTYKLLTIDMYYTGQLTTLWMMDPETTNFFTPVDEPVIDQGEAWMHYTQTWRVEPNPRKELIAIGLQGYAAPAAIDQICISTQCIPEPMTLALMAVGGFYILRRKRSES